MTTFTNYCSPEIKRAYEVTDTTALYKNINTRDATRPDLSLGAEAFEFDVESNLWINNFTAHSVNTRNLEVTHCGGFELSRGYADDELFYDITVTPMSFELGFIVESVALTVTIWNSDPYNVVVLSNIQAINGDDTTIESITFPKNINRFWTFSFDITVSGSGAASQDTIYRLTLDGQDYDITITGIRVIPFTFDIEWESDITITYNYETAMYKTEIFHEQRRPLLHLPFRDMDFTVVNSGRDAGRIFHLTKYGKDKIFGVPVYNEQMIPTTMTSGTYEAFFSGDTTHLWNLNNMTDYVIIMDPYNYAAEIKKIDEIKTSSIVFENAISYSFNLNTAVVYPCLLCVLSDVSVVNYNDSLSGFKVSVTEYR